MKPTMTEKEFRKLEKELEEAIQRLDRLQIKYREQTGVFYVPQVRLK